MTHSKRYAVAVMVVGLVALNIWRWWPQSAERLKSVAPSMRTVPESLIIKAPAMSEKSAVMRRDLFQPRQRVVAAPPKPAPLAAPGPPPKTPEQLAEEAARAELAQIRLVGIAFRGGKGQAFLVKGDQTYLGQVGEKVGDRFTIEAVNPESVVLKDPATNVGGQLSVSGK